jgi:tRNA dimethylallyltransferase
LTPLLPVALVGTTASGKSETAMTVATRRGDVELVCVDSMTVYRGMDIGTAKPGPRARAQVPHHLLDLVDPAEEFSVSQFQAHARAAISGIGRRGNRALLVGGTGLYLRAVVDELELPGRFPEVAAALEREADQPGGVAALHARLAELDPVAASRTTAANRRRVVRALEVTVGSGRPFSSYGPGLAAYPPARAFLVGLPFDPGVVDRRIEERFRRWLEEGLLTEVRSLAARPRRLSRTARQALGYKELLAHVEDGADLEECIAEAVRRTRAYARRQWSWFRRDPRIAWVERGEAAAEIVGRALEAAGGGSGAVHRGRARDWGMLASRTPGRPDPRSVGSRPGGERLVMSKHEGAGNDFLVVLDADGAVQMTRAVVMALCDRRRGVGADGVVVIGPPRAGAAVSMTLFNADGTEAEMSGNGIRCLAQAAVTAGLVRPGGFTVATAAGVRTVDFVAGPVGAEAAASVDMGEVRLGPEVESPLGVGRAREADVGNPHLVVVSDRDPETVDLGAVGAGVARRYPAGVNLEVARVGPEPDTVHLRVLERGVGETAACHDWGLVGDSVRVVNPGGPLEVRLDRSGVAVLGGPVRHVAEIVVDLDAIAGTLGAPDLGASRATGSRR